MKFPSWVGRVTFITLDGETKGRGGTRVEKFSICSAKYRHEIQTAVVFSVLPQHGLEDRLQRDLQVQFICARELHIDGLVPGDDVPCVVHTLDPHSIFVHDVCAVRLLRETKCSFFLIECVFF